MSNIEEINAGLVEDALARNAVFEALVELRKESGLTQRDVAALMGVGQPTISEFESGKITPRLVTIQRYARAVGAYVKVELVIPIKVGESS